MSGHQKVSEARASAVGWPCPRSSCESEPWCRPHPCRAPCAVVGRHRAQGWPSIAVGSLKPAFSASLIHAVSEFGAEHAGRPRQGPTRRRTPHGGGPCPCPNRQALNPCSSTLNRRSNMHPETSHHGLRARGGCQQRRGPPVDAQPSGRRSHRHRAGEDASRLAAFEHERFHAVIGDALDQTVLKMRWLKPQPRSPCPWSPTSWVPSSSDRLTP